VYDKNEELIAKWNSEIIPIFEIGLSEAIRVLVKIENHNSNRKTKAHHYFLLRTLKRLLKIQI